MEAEHNGSSTVQSLEPLIRDVVVLRLSLEAAKAIVAEARAKWDTENASLLDGLRKVQEELLAAESNLRGEALANYVATGNKQVAPGIVIRVNHRAVYDVPTATAWSLAHGGIAHVFDAKVFEKLSLANPALTADFVVVEDVPIATLAKDLKVDA